MRRGPWRAILMGLGLALAPAMAAADPSLIWPNTAANRAEAEIRLDHLQRALSQEPSATLVLEHWCAEYHLAPVPKIVAQRVDGSPKTAPESVRRNLRLTSGEALGYRRVQLFCGDLILSDADNWYVPDRLTPAMNALLDHTDTPFGLAVRSLHFQRRTISSQRLWTPSAAPSAGGLAIPEHVLRNVGLLTTPDGRPISQVVESYTGAVLGTVRNSVP
jgi:chorismate-pyruvate lyase